MGFHSQMLVLPSLLSLSSFWVFPPVILTSSSSSSRTSLSILRNTPSTVPSSPFPYTRFSTLLAISTLPLLTIHRGLSGTPATQSKTTCTAAGTAPSPTIHLHPPTFSLNTHPTPYATTCPPVMNKLPTVTILPLHCPGASSDTYNGDTKLAAPMARPTTLLPTTIVPTDVENA